MKSTADDGDFFRRSTVVESRVVKTHLVGRMLQAPKTDGGQSRQAKEAKSKRVFTILYKHHTVLGDSLSRPARKLIPRENHNQDGFQQRSSAT